MLSQLRQGARGLTADGKRRRAHGLMVAAQTCMAVLLVIGAGLLVRTFVQIKRIDPGFSSGGVVTVPISLPPTRYPDAGDALAFYERLESSLTAKHGHDLAADHHPKPSFMAARTTDLLRGAHLVIGSSRGCSLTRGSVSSSPLRLCQDEGRS